MHVYVYLSLSLYTYIYIYNIIIMISSSSSSRSSTSSSSSRSSSSSSSSNQREQIVFHGILKEVRFVIAEISGSLWGFAGACNLGILYFGSSSCAVRARRGRGN